MKKQLEQQLMRTLESFRNDVARGRDVSLPKITKEIMNLFEHGDSGLAPDGAPGGEAKARIPEGFLGN